MIWFFRQFWRSLSLAMVLLGIFYVPVDMIGVQEASEPWKRWLAVLDRETLAFVVAGAAFLIVLYRDAKPQIDKYLFTTRRNRSVRGGHPSRLRLDFDEGSGRLVRVENVNILRYYYTGGRAGDYLFLAFEKPAGTETVRIRHNDGAVLRYEVLDKGDRTMVLELQTNLNKSGLTFDCWNEKNLERPTISAERQLRLPQGIQEETPQKIPPD